MGERQVHIDRTFDGSIRDEERENKVNVIELAIESGMPMKLYDVKPCGEECDLSERDLPCGLSGISSADICLAIVPCFNEQLISSILFFGMLEKPSTDKPFILACIDDPSEESFFNGIPKAFDFRDHGIYRIKETPYTERFSIEAMPAGLYAIKMERQCWEAAAELIRTSDYIRTRRENSFYRMASERTFNARMNGMFLCKAIADIAEKEIGKEGENLAYFQRSHELCKEADLFEPVPHAFIRYSDESEKRRYDPLYEAMSWLLFIMKTWKSFMSKKKKPFHVSGNEKIWRGIPMAVDVVKKYNEETGIIAIAKACMTGIPSDEFF